MASENMELTVEVSDILPASQKVGQNKSWTVLRDIVKDTRKIVSSLSSRVPTNFHFRSQETPNGPVTRLYFLGIPPKQRESTLMYVNVPTSPMVITPLLQWCCLLDSFSSTLSSNVQLSREELLLRERKRLGVFGITSYEISDDGRIVFPACNSLFTCTDLELNKDDPIFPSSIESSLTGARMDPKICPGNSDLVCFVNCNDLWVLNTSTGQEVRLTHTNKGLGSLREDSLSAGVPSFVVQEEFDRYTGYWWDPCCGTSINKYRILYEVVDEMNVDILQIYSPLEEKGVDEYRYPRSGKTNAKSCLRVVEFTLLENNTISNIVTKCLYDSMESLFPTMEYLVRAGWTPDAKYVHCQVLNRKQTCISLVLIPVECFIEDDIDDGKEMNTTSTHNYPSIYIVHEDTSEIWVNVHDILYFLPSTAEDEICFIWLSEKTGFKHLYKVTSSLKTSSSQLQPHLQEDVLKCDSKKIEPITTGDWEVSHKEIWVDEDRKLVYFIGLKDTPLETHLYVSSYDKYGECIRLTELGYSHSIAFNKERTLFVSVYSSSSVTPMSTLYQVIHSENSIRTQAFGVLMPSSPCTDYNAPVIFNYKSKSGMTMYGMYYRPYGYQPGVKYPTVLFVYGGPHVQLVTNSFKGLNCGCDPIVSTLDFESHDPGSYSWSPQAVPFNKEFDNNVDFLPYSEKLSPHCGRFLRLHTLASQGYAVVMIDGRGSCCRGLKFESHIKNRLGTTEIEDQVEGLQNLMSKVDFIDENRIAIHGWSYGGYLSLMGLAQRPDIFKVAIAGAPVVDWALYDTGYTERYMDVPLSNTYGYHQGNILTYMDSFPDEENRLLIVHGLIDENVHFLHSSILVNALIKACKPHQIQVYPNERHGIRNHEASEHYKTLILNFLDKNL